jgi:hypothetical protein
MCACATSNIPDWAATLLHFIECVFLRGLRPELDKVNRKPFGRIKTREPNDWTPIADHDIYDQLSTEQKSRDKSARTDDRVYTVENVRL